MIARILAGILATISLSAQVPPNPLRNWSPTGAALSGYPYAATALGNSLVLAKNPINLQLYDPAQGIFSNIPDQTAASRFGYTLTALKDGRALLLGGAAVRIAFATNAAYLYEPAASKFVPTGFSKIPHIGHTATLMSDGRVLITGGVTQVFPQEETTAIPYAEIYDPATGTFTGTRNMNVARAGHTGTLLADGRVLIAGGGFPPAEIYDPASGSFALTGPMLVPRSDHFAVLMPNGKVLVGGGASTLVTEEFDPATGRFERSADLDRVRLVSQATLLPSGQVLVAGGSSGQLSAAPSYSSLLYNPETRQFTRTGDTLSSELGILIPLADGRVLGTGGQLYTPFIPGIATSQTGLTFRAAQGAGALPSQMVAVSSPIDSISFSAGVKTFAGGNWLRAMASIGKLMPAAPPVNLEIIADATGLAAGDYHGLVTLTPTDSKHQPVAISIVLTVQAASAPVIAPAGLVFAGLTKTSPPPRSFTISNVSANPRSFSILALEPTPEFFSFGVASGTLAPGESREVAVTPFSSTLAAGVYRGWLHVTFDDQSQQIVDVLLVLADGNGCTPSQLLVEPISIAAEFTAPVGWPVPIVAHVVDSCGNPVNSGTVTASFSNGDPPIGLTNIGGGIWSATWAPLQSSSYAAISLIAASVLPELAGTVQIDGRIPASPGVPVVATGGVLSAGDYIGSPAQGLLVSIFGSGLADGTLVNNSATLATQLGSTSVSISGVPLPMVFVSDGQVNALIPYELAANAPHQLIVRRANAISVPAPISIADNQPGILATAGNGKGQGHVYVINPAQAQILADTKSPAKAGDVLVLYVVGLGPVNPPIKSGDPAPFDKLEPATGTASLTIGGVQAQVVFAGLTPGFSGLYQINAVMPSGVRPGSQVPVVIAVNGRASAGAITMAAQ
jgi:uncharacterized protein (TIGR03437 family)